MSTQINTTDSAAPLRFQEKLGYGLGDAASNFFFQTFNIFLLYYYTDVFGIPAAAVGTMFLVTKIIDAISDPVMGLVADRTNTKWGKFRPYLLWGAIPYGVFGFAMFASPDLSENGKLVYAYITYTLVMLAYTIINVPYSALMGVISSSSMERTKVASYRFICAFGAGWVIATFVGPLKDALGGGDEALGFKLTMALFAAASVVLFWVTFATTKERVEPVQEETDVRLDFRALFSNGPWIVLFLTAIFTLMNVAIRGGTTLFYFKYVVEGGQDKVFDLAFLLFNTWQIDTGLSFDKTSVFLSTGLLAMIVGIALTKTLAMYFEKRSLLIVLTILNAISLGVFFFIPSDQYWLMVGVNCIGSLLAGPTPALVWAMYTDTADYGEWKTGRRTTALIFSSLMFAQKLGLAVGAGLSGIILGAFGYVANEIQTEEALVGIRLTFSLIPAAFAIAGALMVIFYKIDMVTIERMEKELVQRKSESEATA